MNDFKVYSTFYEMLQDKHPELAKTTYGNNLTNYNLSSKEIEERLGEPEGTTIMAIHYNKGILLGGDRRATRGHRIIQNPVDKIIPLDHSSAIGISGAVVACMDLAKILKVEIDFFERVNMRNMSLDGKVGLTARHIKNNLPAALQLGLVAIPILAGYDHKENIGRIYGFGVAGSTTEYDQFHSTGSGGYDAQRTLEDGWHPKIKENEGIDLIIKALFDASQRDNATGTPGYKNGFPIIYKISKDGLKKIEENQIETVTGKTNRERTKRKKCFSEKHSKTKNKVTSQKERGGSSE